MVQSIPPPEFRPKEAAVDANQMQTRRHAGSSKRAYGQRAGTQPASLSRITLILSTGHCAPACRLRVHLHRPSPPPRAGKDFACINDLASALPPWRRAMATLKLCSQPGDLLCCVNTNSRSTHVTTRLTNGWLLALSKQLNTGQYSQLCLGASRYKLLLQSLSCVAHLHKADLLGNVSRDVLSVT